MRAPSMHAHARARAGADRGASKGAAQRGKGVESDSFGPRDELGDLIDEAGRPISRGGAGGGAERLGEG